ncbi:iron uptake transporter deferrochelatase/peroxidase subunit [Branchiibius sp. NY16-3462-2]|uniref:iron uptake transporter deferrochelatase/peroxidase subunit n=1 Tax=Branchiibius sp. NY16-3462-2 TaxID=1807500 RepID=UPI00079267C8|nr:iron uptake transporter deferrochelatase/peroxidase subunit [Branchiibius sp. NY16-3462-2]KYH44941.1 peroxidase [Branchiibius sp. NY16-3462-2]
MTGVNRRQLLAGSAAAGAVGLGGVVAAREAAAATSSAVPSAAVGFHGSHQAGILEQPQANSAHVAFDLTITGRSALAALMKVLTERARALTTGGPSRPVGIAGPATDSGTMGPEQPASGLQVTVGLGASVFDGRFGLASAKPVRLRAMDTFVNDRLDPAECDGDLLLTLSAPDRDTVLHALRDICRATRSSMQIRWRIDGFTPPARPSGAPRNQLGFKDGTANPDVTDSAEMDRLVWVQPGGAEPSWASGGSYHVVRIIRMHVEFWDRVSVSEQERMFGRRKDTGAPLSGVHESDTPDYTDDPKGTAIPLDSHIRVANPRTPQTDSSRILRRSYSYDRGVDETGNLDLGLIFGAFQQDLDRQFVAVQKRLADEPLVDYITPTGGGYFFALPGVRDHSDFYASALLA